LYIVNLKALKVQCLVYPCIVQVVEVDLIISKPIHSRDRNYYINRITLWKMSFLVRN